MGVEHVHADACALRHRELELPLARTAPTLCSELVRHRLRVALAMVDGDLGRARVHRAGTERTYGERGTDGSEHTADVHVSLRVAWGVARKTQSGSMPCRSCSF